MEENNFSENEVTNAEFQAETVNAENFSEPVNYSHKPTSKSYPYAGFWRRVWAFLIDSVIIGVISGVIAVPVLWVQVKKIIALGATAGDASQLPPDVFLSYMGSIFGIQLFGFLALWLYNACMESSAKQATLGKMALGIKVVDEKGERIGFGRATGRAFGKILSNMILYFGNYMAGYTSCKQSLHDIITTTYVVDKNFRPGDELPADKWSTSGLVFAILAAVTPIVLYVLMIIAMIAVGIANTPAA